MDSFVSIATGEMINKETLSYKRKPRNFPNISTTIRQSFSVE